MAVGCESDCARCVYGYRVRQVTGGHTLAVDDGGWRNDRSDMESLSWHHQRGCDDQQQYLEFPAHLFLQRRLLATDEQECDLTDIFLRVTRKYLKFTEERFRNLVNAKTPLS